MPDEPLTGGCNCGGVRFELTSPPLHASYCHCTRCQRRSGAAASPQARVERRLADDLLADFTRAL